MKLIDFVGRCDIIVGLGLPRRCFVCLFLYRLKKEKHCNGTLPGDMHQDMHHIITTNSKQASNAQQVTRNKQASKQLKRGGK